MEADFGQIEFLSIAILDRCFSYSYTPTLYVRYIWTEANTSIVCSTVSVFCNIHR